MELLKHIHLNKLFESKELTHFYLSIILINFGIGLISIFVPIYLYNIGYSIFQILFYFFIWSLSFVILSFPCTKIISKIGVKHSMLMATPFLIFLYIGLNFLPDYKFLFYILPIIYSLNTIFYWEGYHLFFFLHLNRKKRGKEVSIARALSSITVAIAPFIGGLIATKSFTLLFILGSFFILISSIPLFLTKENYVIQNFKLSSIYDNIISKKEKRDFLSFVGSGASAIIETVLWPIYIILIVGTFVKTGFVVAITTSISMIGLYFSGVLTDRFSKVKLIRTWTIFHSIGWFLRIFVNSIFSLIFIDTYKKTTQKLLHIPWTSKIYGLASRRDYFQFIFFMHWSLHITRVIFLPIVMLIFYINFYPFIITFILTGLLSLLYLFINKK